MTQSLWLATAESVSLSSLTSSVTCDVCIIGGGLTGLYTAYTLAKAGVDVVLLEANTHFGHGTTGHSTGKLTAQHSIVYANLLEKLSVEEAQLYYQLNQQAIDQARQILPENSVRQVDSLLYCQSKEGYAQLLKEWNAYKVLNIKSKITSDTELPFPITKALCMSQQAQINPLEVSNFLAKEAQAMGARLYSNTRVQQLNIPQNNLHTEKNISVQYNKLILCSHYPIEAFRGLHLFKLSNSRSYMVASKVSETMQGQYLSVDFPSRSIRTATINNEHYLVLGGANHIAGETVNTEPYYEAISNEMKEHFEQQPLYRWSAQDIETPDIVPYVGRITNSLPNVLIATGYRKWGISNSFVAGDILSSLITGARSEDGAIALYSPSRTKFGAQFMQMLKVGGFVAKEYIAGYMKNVTAPTCTHLGCKTKWNEADETWDCPCHGSRFNAKGEVLEGPAVQPLKLD
ncbi:FAD-dependent oxidoreductase [Lysinibacillus irui]|uniref:FAD-dependent oxidoreductase n=1 Tax=Lysinibacillus irui TaxID=2998077 RepID=A0AAJ5RK73_9BACI|nr:FAD-dependent oxidoreductase [Lysinibacillus irui]MEA0552645.1 FAD-dependent oxidoreductase [Lysinibacillus irui]MEA0563024.1 FAD-dependent oxidoreductase [Lysinibacillus irui]MEA0978597.1 FAD-dependent oxidoreductase [Lysinibacillus irui]MEA1044751.1 FAD-dependent oxidoreductase [Lysinibacillus irui]WDV06531.1 FAD-dependent oxidoreductase [Lysinibacillus irui]